MSLQGDHDEWFFMKAFSSPAHGDATHFRQGRKCDTRVWSRNRLLSGGVHMRMGRTAAAIEGGGVSRRVVPLGSDRL